MPLIYITGVEGSGKSTICEALAAQGYKSIDCDKQGLAKRYHKNSWELSRSLPSKDRVDDEWYINREWKINPSDLLPLSRQAGVKPVFVCGITDNFNEIKTFFDKVICLTLPRDTVISRIQSRDNNDFGKEKRQLEYILRKQEKYENDNYLSGSVMVDASQPFPTVVNKILSSLAG